MIFSRWIPNGLLFLAIGPLLVAAVPKPNVILIITDDQGYGEVAAHGNKVIKTPNMDALHAESVRFTDFHVDPTCSPTRSALLTGRYSTRTGVWHTINGRSLISPDEVTLAEVFKANGYSTAMFGKWHLGENYPCRPQDQGFDHVAMHLGGAIGNAGDYWENDYYDDHYLVNGEWKPFEGYCTDVWFREATKFIEEKKDEPFFLYLPTNSPHAPHIVPDSYAKPYRDAGLPDEMADFYGMITNIDENLGRFRNRLKELGLAENTLLIFMTDNGTTAGWIDQQAAYPYFNAGMRGWKGSAWDGGHRVPCFWHWPAGKIAGGREVDLLTAHFDVLPTLVELLGLKKPDEPVLDGTSLVSHLQGATTQAAPERALFVHVQRAFQPPKWEKSAVMTKRWRLMDGKELYDIQKDPGQKTDLAAKHGKVVGQLRAEYEQWWKSLQPAIERTVRIELGGAENPMTLSSHDWLMPGEKHAAWHQKHVMRGDLINGGWAVDVKTAGKYKISLYRWPPYLNKPMGSVSARLEVAGVKESMDLEVTAPSASFEVTLAEGETMLQTWLSREDGGQHGAYYCTIELLDKS